MLHEGTQAEHGLLIAPGRVPALPFLAGVSTHSFPKQVFLILSRINFVVVIVKQNKTQNNKKNLFKKSPFPPKFIRRLKLHLVNTYCVQTLSHLILKESYQVEY